MIKRTSNLKFLMCAVAACISPASFGRPSLVRPGEHHTYANMVAIVAAKTVLAVIMNDLLPGRDRFNECKVTCCICHGATGSGT